MDSSNESAKAMTNTMTMYYVLLRTTYYYVLRTTYYVLLLLLPPLLLPLYYYCYYYYYYYDYYYYYYYCCSGQCVLNFKPKTQNLFLLQSDPSCRQQLGCSFGLISLAFQGIVLV